MTRVQKSTFVKERCRRRRLVKSLVNVDLPSVFVKHSFKVLSPFLAKYSTFWIVSNNVYGYSSEDWTSLLMDVKSRNITGQNRSPILWYVVTPVQGFSSFSIMFYILHYYIVSHIKKYTYFALFIFLDFCTVCKPIIPTICDIHRLFVKYTILSFKSSSQIIIFWY